MGLNVSVFFSPDDDLVPYRLSRMLLYRFHSHGIYGMCINYTILFPVSYSEPISFDTLDCSDMAEPFPEIVTGPQRKPECLYYHYVSHVVLYSYSLYL
jgi:hypothetical protein